MFTARYELSLRIIKANLGL